MKTQNEDTINKKTSERGSNQAGKQEKIQTNTPGETYMVTVWGSVLERAMGPQMGQ